MTFLLTHLRTGASGLFAAALLVVAVPGIAFAQAQPKLPVAPLSAGMHVIQAEVADNFVSRMTGMMHRTTMGANEGMLFVFEESGRQCMWMKNTLIPLSVAYLADDGAIVNIEDMQPQSEESHCSKAPVRFALEMNRGWFSGKGIKPGTRIRGLEKFKPR
jgi:uncharacterized membrane protein (UPF0127 family)